MLDWWGVKLVCTHTSSESRFSLCHLIVGRASCFESEERTLKQIQVGRVERRDEMISADRL